VWRRFRQQCRRGSSCDDHQPDDVHHDTAQHVDIDEHLDHIVDIDEHVVDFHDDHRARDSAEPGGCAR
jgi:hypothetical protein